ncbi:MAG: hypothetical protein GWO11_03585 [Desulfuromonadales bacterium]|nr:hypothetical protein [Desulfuromonadales bacterium]NIR33528.1 hypothetical protein [Desulfuromonadales bacterium]NIS39702.1 hypothetical protein [Desulfuromonadales bacterium]
MHYHLGHLGLRYAGSVFSTVLLGVGAAVGGSFLVSRMKDKQDVADRLDRLEQMLSETEQAQAATKATAQKKTPAK